MPAVNLDLMLQAMIDSAEGKPNQIVYWSRLPDWKIQTLTPNPDVIYLMPFFNTKDVGPMVLEIPPADGGSITGTIMDAWQAALEDVGPAGVDKGKGGKYLILPPGYKGEPPDGYIALPSHDLPGLRAAALESRKRQRCRRRQGGRLRQAHQVLSAVAGRQSAGDDVRRCDRRRLRRTIPYDLRFFQSLDRFVQIEPWLTRDKVMIDMLKSIGIEKGKPFNPDARTQDILNAAAREAHAWLDARYEAVFPSFNEGSQWAFPASPEFAEDDGERSMRSRMLTRSMGAALADSYAYITAKHLGAGQFYLMTAKDKDGRALDGASTYRLNVPADAPVKQYWSATVYDRATHALIRDMPTLSRSSQSPGLQKNADGSVDRLFRPEGAGGQGSELGADERRRAVSKCCSASTVRRNRSSTRRGCCRTSRK